MASLFIREIEERFEPLLHNPEIGPKRDFIETGLRAHFHKSYVIYYRIIGDALVIVRVLHGARDVAAQFGEHGD